MNVGERMEKNRLEGYGSPKGSVFARHLCTMTVEGEEYGLTSIIVIMRG